MVKKRAVKNISLSQLKKQYGEIKENKDKISFLRTLPENVTPSSTKWAKQEVFGLTRGIANSIDQHIDEIDREYEHRSDDMATSSKAHNITRHIEENMPNSMTTSGLNVKDAIRLAERASEEYLKINDFDGAYGALNEARLMLLDFERKGRKVSGLKKKIVNQMAKISENPLFRDSTQEALYESIGENEAAIKAKEKRAAKYENEGHPDPHIRLSIANDYLLNGKYDSALKEIRKSSEHRAGYDLDDLAGYAQSVSEVYKEDSKERSRDSPEMSMKYFEKSKEYKMHAKNIRKLSKIKRGKVGGGIESKVTAFLAILLGGAGLAIVSGNITGNVIATGNNSTSNIVGVGLIAIGLIGSYFYFKKK